MKRAILILLLCALPAWAAGIKAEKAYEPYEPIVLKATDITSAKAQFLWDVDGAAKVRETGDTLYVWAPPGKYRVRLTAIDFEAKKVERASFDFTVGGTPPGPDPPGPVPPGPTPPPGPSPIPGDGLRVLMVYETAEVSKMPPAQQAVIYSKTVRDYLNSKCPVGADGKTKDWRIFDKDIDLTGEDKLWADAMKRDRKSVPWIVIGTGKSGYEGPLPASVEEALKLLKQYGG